MTDQRYPQGHRSSDAVLGPELAGPSTYLASGGGVPTLLNPRGSAFLVVPTQDPVEGPRFHGVRGVAHTPPPTVRVLRSRGDDGGRSRAVPTTPGRLSRPDHDATVPWESSPGLWDSLLGPHDEDPGEEGRVTRCAPLATVDKTYTGVRHGTSYPSLTRPATPPTSPGTLTVLSPPPDSPRGVDY